MSEAENRALARRWFEGAHNEGNLAPADTGFRPGGHSHPLTGPPALPGPAHRCVGRRAPRGSHAPRPLLRPVLRPCHAPGVPWMANGS